MIPKISFPESVMKLKLPANCVAGEEIYYEMNLEGQVRACKVLTFNNIWINRELMLWNEDGDMIIEGFAYPWIKDKLFGSFKNKLKFKVKNLIRRIEVVQEPVLWCLDGFSTGGYYHWITEILPRLWMIKEVLPSLKFAIPDYFFKKWPFSKEYFSLLGIKNFLIIENSTKYKVKQLVLPTRAGDPFYRQHEPLTEGVKWLQQSALAISSKSFGDRIYISRNKAKYRKVENEIEILPILEKHGFKVVYFEELSLSDQISVCQNAKVLMGLHGAGLTNLVFLPFNSKVIEIRPTNAYHMYNCFFTLAHHFDCEYNYILCDYSTTSLPTEKRIDDHSVVVAPTKLDVAIKNILKEE